MLERLLVVAIVFVLVSVAAIVVRRRSGVGADRLRRTDPTPLWSALRAQPDGRPAVVVFRVWHALPAAPLSVQRSKS